MVLAIFAMGLGFSAALGVNVYKFKFQFSSLVVGLSLVGAMVSVWSLSSPLVKVVERSLERETEKRHYLFYAMCILRTLVAIGIMVLGVIGRRYWADPFMEMPIIATALAGLVLLAVTRYQLAWANDLAGKVPGACQGNGSAPQF